MNFGYTVYDSRDLKRVQNTWPELPILVKKKILDFGFFVFIFPTKTPVSLKLEVMRISPEKISTKKIKIKKVRLT